MAKGMPSRPARRPATWDNACSLKAARMHPSAFSANRKAHIPAFPKLEYSPSRPVGFAAGGSSLKALPSARITFLLKRHGHFVFHPVVAAFLKFQPEGPVA